MKPNCIFLLLFRALWILIISCCHTWNTYSWFTLCFVYLFYLFLVYLIDTTCLNYISLWERQSKDLRLRCSYVRGVLKCDHHIRLCFSSNLFKTEVNKSPQVNKSTVLKHPQFIKDMLICNHFIFQWKCSLWCVQVYSITWDSSKFYM